MEKIFGHSKEINELVRIIQKQSVNHAYMFCGIDGIGKHLVAKQFAKSILCNAPIDGYFCGNCDSCKTFDNSSDFITIEAENGLIKVDSIRHMSEEVILKPTVSHNKVVIINDADLMNESSQNALLKMLEEPPVYAVFILICSNKEKIISTIKSRCTIINFNELTIEDLQNIFKDDVISNEMYLYSSGSAGKYLKLKDSNFIDNITMLQSLLEEKSLLKVNSIMSKFKEDKSIKENINDILDLFIIRLGSELANNSIKTIKQIKIVEDTRNNITRNANFDIQLDYMALKLWQLN